MKHGGLRVVCLILWACIALMPAFSDEQVQNETTILLETFDETDASEYDWKAAGSQFSTKTEDITYPMVRYVEYVSSQIPSNGSDEEQSKSLGVRGAFNRKGPNWIDVYPVQKGEEDPIEIPLPGRVKSLSLWVWGMNLRYNLQVYVRDYRGVIHVLDVGANQGSLDFQGWRNLRAIVPQIIPQSKKVVPHLAALRLVKFRITTNPKEQVIPFSVYFDHLTVLTDTYESIYDGQQLADPATIDSIWNSEGGQ
jgi:hypothetical protein